MPYSNSRHNSGASRRFRSGNSLQYATFRATDARCAMRVRILLADNTPAINAHCSSQPCASFPATSHISLDALLHRRAFSKLGCWERGSLRL